MQRGRLQRCTCCISAADDRIYAEQPQSAWGTPVSMRDEKNSETAPGPRCPSRRRGTRRLTIVETRAPHDYDLRTGPKPWPVAEPVDALPCMSAAIDSEQSGR
jgi:hypothetical protein